MANGGKMILGILGAAAAGVIVGMLIAPEKGEDLRNNLKKTAEDWMDEFAKLTGKGKDYVNDLKNQAMAGVNELRDDAEENINGVSDGYSKRRPSSN